MMAPTESYQRQCDWSEGWDAAERHFEKHYEQRLDQMAEEYEALLKSATRTIDDIQELIG
jgi:hypothetical protein